MTNELAKNQSDFELLTSRLLATLDESIFFPTLGKFLHSVIPADHSLVRIVRDNDSCQVICIDGKFVEDGELLEKGVGPAGNVIRTRRPYFSNSTSRDPLFAEFTDKSIKAELIMPIAQEGIVIATVHFQCSSSEHEFSREDITKIQKILNDIKDPLSNMKMYLSAKHLNESLVKQINAKEKELQKKDTSASTFENYVIEEKDIVGKSSTMKKVVELADKVATMDVNGLLLGERGAGKEMIARRIHCRSIRSKRAFISIDCSAYDEASLEREIFGEETLGEGNVRIKNGLLELANGGTLFINSIEKLSLGLQSKLNIFLNESVSLRVGGKSQYKVDVRIFAASSLDLNHMVEEGRMREDFLFKLNTIILSVPSLKERKEDIESLAVYFLNVNKKAENQKSFSPGAINLLLDYDWPGNVRELQNIIERAYILSDNMIVESDHLSECVSKSEIIEEEDKNVLDFSEMTLDELERRHITMTLDHLAGNKTKTAKMLGITVKTLYNKLHSYGMIRQKEA